MWLKEIKIQACILEKTSNNKWKLKLTVLPIDENNNLEPKIWLRVYINDILSKTLNSDEDGKIQDEYAFDYYTDGVSVHITDITWKIKSKIKYLIDPEKEEIAQQIKEEEIQLKEKNIEDIKKKEQDDGYIKEAIAKLKVDPQNIWNITQDERNNKEIVNYALVQNWMLLEYTGENIKRDKEMVELAMSQDISAFKFAADTLKVDEDFISKLLGEYWLDIVGYLSNYMLNINIIKTMVSQLREKEKKQKKLKVDKLEEEKRKIEEIKWSLKEELNKLIKEKSILEQKFKNISLISDSIVSLDSLIKRQEEGLPILIKLKSLWEDYLQNSVEIMKNSDDIMSTRRWKKYEKRADLLETQRSKIYSEYQNYINMATNLGVSEHIWASTFLKVVNSRIISYENSIEENKGKLHSLKLDKKSFWDIVNEEDIRDLSVKINNLQCEINGMCK